MSILSAKKELDSKKQSSDGNDDDKEKSFTEKQQILADAKRLKKKDFLEKYKNITPAQYKNYGIPGKVDLEELHNRATNEWSSDQINKDLGKYKTQKEKIAKDEEALNTQSGPISDYIKGYSGSLKQNESLKKTIKEKYKHDVDNPFKEITPEDARNEIYKGITTEAENRIKNKNDVRVPGSPDEKNTCISGTCTLAANQGVDFSKIPGRIDAQGRNIPINNESFYNNLKDSGYAEIPYDQRMPGDFVQYDEDGKKEHMEVLLNKNAKNGADRNFNNYSLSNYKTEQFNTPGESFRKLEKTPDGKLQATNLEAGFDPFSNSRVLRLTDEAAMKAYNKKHPEYALTLNEFKKNKQAYESSPEAKQYQTGLESTKNKNAAILGSDAGLFDELVSGYSGKYANDKEGLINSLKSKSKNPALLAKVVNKIYEQTPSTETAQPSAQPTTQPSVKLSVKR